MSESISRVFLGWDRPGLQLTSEYLVKNYLSSHCIDCRNVAVVVPGKRAGRRLTELLADAALKHTAGLLLPRFLTAGSLPECIIGEPEQPTTPLEQLLAWIKAAEQIPFETLNKVFHTRKADSGSFDTLFSFAEVCARLYDELSAAGRSFNDVARCVELDFELSSSERWLILEQVWERYQVVLEEGERIDKYRRRQELLENSKEFTLPVDLVLVGAVDLNPLTRSLLSKVQSPVVALIHAPDSEAAGFDSFGCLDTNYWRAYRVALRDDQVRVQLGAREQAAGVVEELAKISTDYTTDDIVLGVADSELSAYIDEECSRLGCAVRAGAGQPVIETRPGQVLALLHSYLRTKRMADFLRLIRHPDCSHWWALELFGATTDGKPQQILRLLDQYQREHVQFHIAHTVPGEGKQAEAVQSAVKVFQRLFGALLTGQRSVLDWSEQIEQFLVRLYGSLESKSSDPEQEVLVEACKRVQSVLSQLRGVAESFAEQLSSAQMLALLLHELRNEALPEQPVRSALPLLGWLELALDDAPVLIVAGMNEGRVPQSLNSDPFLPNAIRKSLELLDNDRRFARDVYALASMAASKEHLLLLAGRRDAQGNPLAPSRLLYGGEASLVAKQVLQFFRDSSDGGSLAPNVTAPREDWLLGVKPDRLAAPIESVPVTAFRTYLACPYRFYLKHVLKLETVPADSEELDARVFGMLAHEVLARFAISSLSSSVDEQAISDLLSHELDELAKIQFGTQAAPAVYVQIEQLRARLRGFARWQALHVSQGWRIRYAEKSLEDPLRIKTKVGALAVTGRIDRIDYHEQEQRWAIIDYKTAEKSVKPLAAHRGRQGWTDVQLPAYVLMCEANGFSEPVTTGYVSLSVRADDVTAEFHTWTDEQLQEVKDIMQEVADGIHSQVFWPPREVTSKHDDFALLCSQLPEEV